MNPRKKSFAKINFVGSFFQTARDIPGQLRRLVRPVATLALVALLTAAFLYSGSSASSRQGSKSSAPASTSGSAERKAGAAEAWQLLKLGRDLSSILPAGDPLARFFQPQVAETIQTFAADCTTPKTSFTLGDTICVKTNGVIANGHTNRFVNFLTPDTAIINTTGTITTDPQTFLYTLPTSSNVIVAGNPTTTVGTWKATIADPSDSSINPTYFDVSGAAPSLATYASDCTTPKTVFNYGDTICAKVTGVDTGINRRIAWVDPSNYIRENGGNLFTPVTTDPQSESFVLPSTDATTIDTATIDNRGVWAVTVVSNTGSVQLSAPFTLQGPTPTTDLAVTTGFAIGDESTGEPITYIVNVTNQGPNDAATVELTNPTLINATFQSVVQTSGGTTFSCTGSGPVTCTAANLPAGESAVFEFTYLTGSGGSSLVNTASVTSATEELDSTDNNSIAPTVVVGGGNPGDGCQLSCPTNMVVSADTTQGGNPGAIVNFSSEPSGNCGAVTSSPASGSFFPVGTTTVTSQSATGGGVCSFTVTVIDSAPPTITCAADQTETAGANDIEKVVTVNTPTATGNNVAVTGVRSDNRDVVADPYPVGTTTITWTATDADGRIATCKQKITVTSPGAPTITCPADKTVNADAGSCEATGVNLGTPTTTGDGVTVTGSRNDGQALSDPYPAGTTIVTWTAVDSIGRTVSCLQTVTVNNANDTTPPTITAPPNVTATTNSCSAVVDDELGAPTASDECSGVIITSARSDGQLLNKPFPTGTTTITYTARDSNNNTATATQTVTVLESPASPPTVGAPAAVTLYTGAGNASCSVTVANLDATLGTATAADNCPGVTVARSGVPAGNVFPVGTTTVTYTATDRSGNTATATQTVTVIDNTAPVITVNGNNPITVECHTAFSDPGATANDACDGNRTVTTTGSVNPNAVGTYTLTYTATDTKGNTATATRTVNVVDTIPPTISCNADIVVNYNPAVNGAVVTYTTPVGTDSCAGTITAVRTAGLSSGSTFPLGTTTNTFTVTDTGGNTASCSFKVTVALTSLIGLDSVSITGSASADSYDSTGGYPASQSSLANVLSNGTITLAGSGKVWGNVRSTRAGVVMSGASQVTGNATAGTTVSTSGSATVGGTKTNNALAPVMTLPAVVACGPPYSSNSGISGTYSYSASTGDLTLSGVNIATLASGTYCFRNLTVSNSAQLRVSGPVVIKLTGTLNASGAALINATTSNPSSLKILSSYSGSNGVVLSNSANSFMVVYAPKTDVTISGAGPLFGTVAGKTLTLSNSGKIHYDIRLLNIWPALWPLILGP